jgi:Protein of unknown function (DUF1064)
MTKKKKKPTYNGITFDSGEEINFYIYLEELKANSLIKSFEYITESTELIPAVYGTNKGKRVPLLRSLSYTPDFKIVWGKKLKLWSNLPDCGGYFWANNGVSIVDVKGDFGGRGNSTAVTFPIRQKIFFQSTGLYVQKIVPNILFRDTFLPESLRKTPTGRTKIWKFPIRSIDKCELL